MGIVGTQDFEKEPIRAGSRQGGIEGSLGPGFCYEGFSHVYLYAWVQSGSLPFICLDISLDMSVSEDLPFHGLVLQESHLDGVQLASDSHPLVAVYMSKILFGGCNFAEFASFHWNVRRWGGSIHQDRSCCC